MSTTITVTECDDGGELRAEVGDTIEIRLPENASGGYRWSLDCEDDKGPLEFGCTGWVYPRETVGSAGEAVFTARVRAAGDVRVRLNYGRPWVGESGVRQTFSIVVHATKPVGEPV